MAPRLPSVQLIASDAALSARRFPEVLAAALVAAVAAVLLVDGPGAERGLVRLLLAAQLGIPFFLLLVLSAERLGREGRPTAGIVLRLLGVAALVSYGLSLPARVDGVPIVRWVQLNVALHLAVSALPLLGLAGENAFWQFNRLLAQRMAAGLVFAGVLMAGLSIALLALDKLFGVPVDGELYPRLYVVIGFVFTTWYFLGGVPAEPLALESLEEFPGLLRILGQYILAPLVAVYLSLLTAYLVKVLATTQWPSGWIGWLVSSVGAAGLLSLALLRPLAERQRWVRVYARLYFLLLLPAVVMLLMSAAKRIGQYGLTENRYFLVLLGLWLGAVALAGALGRLRSLRPLPLTLCVLALASSLGPWGAFAMSERSQRARLEGLLAAGGMIVDGRLALAAIPPGEDARREISATLHYLVDTHGVRSLDPLVDDTLRDALREQAATGRPDRQDTPALCRTVMARLDLEYREDWRYAGGGAVAHFVSRERGGEAVDVRGYAWCTDVNLGEGQPTADFSAGGRSGRLALRRDRVLLSVDGVERLAFDLAALRASLGGPGGRPGQSAPAADLRMASEGDGWRALLLLDQLSWRQDGDSLRGQEVAGQLLLAPPDTGP
ncbi:MAG: DUF4153 domain-containing protein [Candidatus Latescibacteria bacterium]|nr:DUF4153 domain-containing protein [bacterium]MCB9516222.1 DUF4153 domain-containing protein [Candidatus Latescibacterota bacterium]